MSDPKRTSWPYAIALVYALFAAAMTGFVVFAVRHPTDLVSRDYYQKEIRYQQQIDSEHRAQKDPDAPTVAINDRLCIIHYPGVPPEGGLIKLYRPSDAALDQSMPMKLDDRRNQTVDLAGISAGLWRLRLEWTRNGQNYFREEVCMLKE